MKPKVGMYVLLDPNKYDNYWVKIGKIVFVYENFIRIKAIEYTTDDKELNHIFKLNDVFEMCLPLSIYTIHKNMESLLATAL